MAGGIHTADAPPIAGLSGLIWDVQIQQFIFIMHIKKMAIENVENRLTAKL